MSSFSSVLRVVSTETALLKVRCSTNRSQASFYLPFISLLLLDRSTALVSILLQWLHTFIGLSDITLDWFCSHLSERIQSVYSDDTLPRPPLLSRIQDAVLLVSAFSSCLLACYLVSLFHSMRMAQKSVPAAPLFFFLSFLGFKNKMSSFF